MGANWLDVALCGACAMEGEFVVKVIAVVRAAGCWRERKKFLLKLLSKTCQTLL